MIQDGWKEKEEREREKNWTARIGRSEEVRRVQICDSESNDDTEAGGRRERWVSLKHVGS